LLDFSEAGTGDITDRKTNAFAKHDRLIASIATALISAQVLQA
jgi:hypothetical protein